MSSKIFLKNINNQLLINLKNNIKELMESKSLSIYSIEKRIGKNNLNKILKDERQMPSINLIYEIANILEVTIDELVYRPKNKISDQKIAYTLLKDIVDNTFTFIENNPNWNLNYRNLILSIVETYKHSFMINHSRIDKDFAEFTLKKNLISSSS